MSELFRYYPIGGVNLLVDDLRIRDDEAVRLKNLYPSLGGKLEKRRGAQYHTWVNDSMFGFDPQELIPTNFDVPNFQKGSIITTLSKISKPSASYIVLSKNAQGPSGVFPSITSYECPYNVRPNILSLGVYTLVSTGKGLAGSIHDTFGCVYVIYTNPETGDMSFISSGGIPYGPVFKDRNGRNYAPSVMGLYRNRVVYGGFEAPFQDIIVFSDQHTAGSNGYKVVESGSDWHKCILDNSSRTIRVNALNGSRITALVEISASGIGGVPESQLLILSENNAAIMTGEPTLTTETVTWPPPFTLAAVQYECGCASPETVARTPSGLIWASWNDVWAMEWGGVPRRVGTKIRPALMSCAPEFRNWWHAVYDHYTGSYRLAIWSPDQNQTGWTGEPVGDQWWLDVRNGIPKDAASAAWFGPQRYLVACDPGLPPYKGTYMMRSVQNSIDFSCVLAPYMISSHPDSVGYGKSLAYANLDKQTGYDTCRPLYRPSDGAFLNNIYTEIDNEISIEIISKRFDLGDIAHDKIYGGLEVGVWADELLALAVEVSVDGGRIIDDEYVVLPQIGMIADVDSVDTYNETHEYQSVVVNPDPDKRMTGKTFQLKIYDKPGIPIPSESPGTAFLAERDGYPTVVCTLDPASLGTNFFADVDAFKDIIASILGLWVIPRSLFVASIVSNKVRFQNTDGYSFLFRGAGWTDADQLRSSRKVGAILGLTDANGSYYLGSGIGSTVDANVSVRRKLCAHLELADMFIRVSRFYRRPSGGRYEAKIP